MWKELDGMADGGRGKREEWPLGTHAPRAGSARKKGKTPCVGRDLGS